MPRTEIDKKKVKRSNCSADNLKRIRSEKHMTQEQVAEKDDPHINYISSVERGHRNLSIGNIERIARALGI